MSTEATISRRAVLTDPGIILLIVLLLMSAIIFIWWPTELYFKGIAVAGWVMFATMPVSIALTGIYVFWMERLEKVPHTDRNGASASDPAEGNAEIPSPRA